MQSYIGVQLTSVLVANNIGPVLIIAFTNHALDHLVSSILKAHITTKVIRLGKRSSDPDVAARSLEELEKDQHQSRLDPSINRAYRAIKELEDQMKELSTRIAARWVNSDQVQSLLEFSAVDHFDSLVNPHAWISALYDSLMDDAKEGWSQKEANIQNYFEFWNQGKDIDVLEAYYNPPPVAASDAGPSNQQNRFDIPTNPLEDGGIEDSEDSEDADADEHSLPTNSPPNDNPTRQWASLVVPVPVFRSHPPSPQLAVVSGTARHRASEEFIHDLDRNAPPKILTQDRDVIELLDDHDVWAMSRSERRKLGYIWIEQARMKGHEIERAEFEELRTRHKEAQNKYNNLKDEVPQVDLTLAPMS